MSPSSTPNAMTLTGALMVCAVLTVFFLFVFFLIIYVRSNLFLEHNPSLHSSPTIPSPLRRRALHPAVLNSLPLSVFNSAQFHKDYDGIECAVCISELTDGELFRLLPGCRHAFHLDCIDLWFGSNSTCPVCRSSVELPKKVGFSNVEQQSCCSGEGCSRRDHAAGESSVFWLQSEEVKLTALASVRSVRGWDVERGMPPPPPVGRVEEVGGEVESI